MDAARNPDWNDSCYGSKYCLQEPSVGTRQLEREDKRKACTGHLAGLLGQCARGAMDVAPCNSCFNDESRAFRTCRQVLRKSYGNKRQSFLWGGACAYCVFRKSKRDCSLYQSAGIEDINNKCFEKILGSFGQEKGMDALRAPRDEHGDLEKVWQSDAGTDGVRQSDSENSELMSEDPESEGSVKGEY
ncbi:MAG: hypothetical protein Q9165_008896 [Trypethelium subeluteriae]